MKRIVAKALMVLSVLSLNGCSGKSTDKSPDQKALGYLLRSQQVCLSF